AAASPSRAAGAARGPARAPRRPPPRGPARAHIAQSAPRARARAAVATTDPRSRRAQATTARSRRVIRASRWVTLGRRGGVDASSQTAAVRGARAGRERLPRRAPLHHARRGRTLGVRARRGHAALLHVG